MEGTLSQAYLIRVVNDSEFSLNFEGKVKTKLKLFRFSYSLLIDWLWWGETMSQNCGHRRAYCSSPGDMWAWRAMVTMPAGDNSWVVHQSSLAVLPAETYGASRGNRQRVRILPFQYLKYLKGSLTCRKVLLPLALLPIQRKVCCGFLSPIKIHRLDRVWTHDSRAQWQAR
jgi:hypothetical protein